MNLTYNWLYPEIRALEMGTSDLLKFKNSGTRMTRVTWANNITWSRKRVDNIKTVSTAVVREIHRRVIIRLSLLLDNHRVVVTREAEVERGAAKTIFAAPFMQRDGANTRTKG